MGWVINTFQHDPMSERIKNSRPDRPAGGALGCMIQENVRLVKQKRKDDVNNIVDILAGKMSYSLPAMGAKGV